MGRIILLAIALVLSPHADGSNILDRDSRFNSVEAFVSSLQAFAPSQTDSWLSYQFSAAEEGQPEDPATGRMVRPAKIESCAAVWESMDAAAVFATARPATTSTPSEVGLLFSLCRVGPQWHIVACKRFEASGKYASLGCKLTSGADSDKSLSQDQVIVTVIENQGGRGYSWQASASYGVSDKIKQVDLE